MKNTFSLCFLTFICFIVIGYSTSTFLFADTNNNAEVTSISSSPAGVNIASIQSMKNGQRSILLVNVDSISKENPSLQGVWLLTYLPDDNHLYFLPIFPIGNSTISELEDRLYHSFGTLPENGKLVLDQDFIDELKAENYWWSGYLIYDQGTQEKIIGILTGNNTLPLEQKNTTLLPDVLDDPQSVYANQLASIKNVCHYLSAPQNTDWSKLIFLISNQFYSDFDPQLLLADWNSMAASNQAQQCLFPTLPQQATAEYAILLTSIMK